MGSSDPKYVAEGFPGGGLTWTELHAALLGLVGVLAGSGVRLGFDALAAAATALLVALAFGLSVAGGGIAGRVVQREPWYFLVVFVATAVLAWGVPLVL